MEMGVASMLNTRSDLQRPVPAGSWDHLSRAYAERVEQLNEMRERLDRIGEILMPYLESPQPVPLEIDDLKRVLELAEYGGTARPRSY
jgi:hypothetical protein